MRSLDHLIRDVGVDHLNQAPKMVEICGNQTRAFHRVGDKGLLQKG